LENAGYRTAQDIHAAVTQGAIAAVIATDTSRHSKDAQAALAERLDLLVEKPMSKDVQESLEIRNLAVESEQRAFVACVMRFSESLDTFRKVLLKAGRLHSVRVEARSYLPDWRPDRPYQESYSARADEGGVLRDLIHEIDYTGWIFGWPDALQARLRNLGRLGINSEETADLEWETPGGCSLSMSLDYLSKPPRRGITAHGESGTVEWNIIDGAVKVATDQGVEEFHSTQTIDDMFSDQAKAFIKVIQGEADPRLATSDDGVRAMVVCDTARRSSASRREEAVVYP
jgi:predicted dehydrogenase